MSRIAFIIFSAIFEIFTLQTYGIPPMNTLVPRLQDSQQSQFYLHDQPQIQRRMWGQPPPAQSLANEMAAVGYQQPIDSRCSPLSTGKSTNLFRIRMNDT